jgi:hypothetical protein
VLAGVELTRGGPTRVLLVSCPIGRPSVQLGLLPWLKALARYPTTAITVAWRLVRPGAAGLVDERVQAARAAPPGRPQHCRPLC